MAIQTGSDPQKPMERRPAYIQEGWEEAEKQRQIIARLKESDQRPRTYFLSTMGCQMNARDSEKLKGILFEIGAVPAPEDEADLVIYNTCCVRENAEQKVYGRLGYLKSVKRKNPRMKIVLCGCMMQEDTVLEKLKKSYPEVDLIFGTYNIYKFPELLETMLETQNQIIDIWQAQQEIVEDLPSIRKYPFKASVNIMYGCDNFCTYCIVPYVRGREISRPLEEIDAQARAYVEAGVKEITLLGQNVNSYGRDLYGKTRFDEVLDLVAATGVERIRFATSHPKDLSDAVIERFTTIPNLMPALHLPVQSGSDAVLKAMNRNYTAEHYLKTIGLIKKYMVVIGEMEK